MSVERFTHKGLIVKIEQDDDCTSPLEQGDLMPRFARFQSGYENPAPEFRRWEDVRYAVKKEGAVAFGVWGGSWGSQGSSFDVRPDENPFADEDCGREFFGFVVYPKTLIPEVGDGSGDRALLFKDAEATIAEYEKWCNGDCYWYAVENLFGEVLESSGGYIGLEYAISEAKSAAESCAGQEAARIKTYTAVKLDEDGDEEEYDVNAVSMADALRQLDFDPIRISRDEVAA